MISKETLQVLAMLAFLIFLMEGEGIDGYWLIYETGTLVQDGLTALGEPNMEFISEGFTPRWNSIIALLIIVSSLLIARNKK